MSTYAPLHLASFKIVPRMYALQVMKSQAITFFIDCPTSKTKVTLASLTAIGEAMQKMKHQKFCIYIACGARMDLVTGVKNNCKVNFESDVNIFVVSQSTGALQTRRSVPTYAVVVASPNHPLKNVPAHAETNKCRASGWEALRQRCVDPNCPHLKGGPAAQAANAEGFKDDVEKEAEGETLAIDEDNTGATIDAEAEFLDVKDVLKKGKAEAKDIFCCAKPLDFYEKTLTTILGLTQLSAGKIAVITRTAHPGLPVAARLLNLEVLLCVEDCPPHSRGHGDELMLKFWKQLKWKEAQAATAPKEVRNVGSSELTFLTALAPEKEAQVVQARFPPPETFCMSRYTNICQIIYAI